MKEHINSEAENVQQGNEGVDPYLMVEIGASSTPLLRSAALLSDVHRDLFRNQPNLQYFAVDIDEVELDRGQKEIATLEQAGQLLPGQIRYVTVKEEDSTLPFENNSVSEVIFKNTMGAGYIKIQKRQEMLHEAARILKPGGLLKIFEIYTPPAATKEGGPIEYIRKNMTDVFEEPQVGDMDLINHEFLDKMLLDKLSDYEKRFVLRFRKKTGISQSKHH